MILHITKMGTKSPHHTEQTLSRPLLTIGEYAISQLMEEANTMNVSANTVFHFTRTYANLLGILEKEFKPRYNHEDLTNVMPDIANFLYQTYIPMTCFCDIPLSAIQDHATRYGSYAIGLTKEWAKKMGLNPILYLRENSQMAEYVKELIKGFRNHTELSIDPPLVQSFYELMSHIKAYEQPAIGTDTAKVFYNEREWRYVPRISNDKSYSRLTSSDYNNTHERIAAERKIDERHRLRFEPNDIRYLIVSNDEEILQLARKIPTIKSKYSPDDQLLLTTKVKSMESLKEDI